MTVLGTVVRGLRSRALLSAATLAMMVLAVAGAVLGPVFQEASTDSYTLNRIDDTPDPLTALSWEARASPASAPGDAATGRLDALVGAALEAIDRIKPAGYAAPQVTLLTEGLPRPLDGALVRYLSRDDVCATLEIDGRCPEGLDEVLVNASDQFSLAIGDTIALPALGDVEIVGVYRQPETTDDYLLPSVLAGRTTASGASPAPFVISPEAMATLPPSVWTPQFESRLVVTDGLDDQALDRVVAETGSLASATTPLDGGRLTGTSTVNALGSVLDDVREQREAARSAVTPAVVALVLVALAMILRLQIAATGLRGPELALAALRGVGARRSWVLGLSEPWLLVVLSLPLGVLGGYGAMRALAATWLRPGLPLTLPTTSVAGAVVVVVVMAGVSAVALGQGMRETLDSRLAGVRRPGRSPRLALLVELLVVLLAAALPLTRLGGDADGLGLADLLLPVATAIAAGLLATRLVAVGATWWTARGAQRPLAVFVAARAVARRSAGTLVILPIAAAIAVSVFAVGVDSVAAGWRGSVAATTAPSDDVYDSPLTVDETLQLTRDLDPDGRWVMTTARLASLGAGAVELVDASRLGRVASWSPQWLDGASGAEAGALVSPDQPLVRLTADRVGLTVSTRAGGSTVVLGVRTASGPATLRVGPFAVGTSTVTAESDLCSGGCTVESITLENGAGPVEVGDLIADDVPVSPDLASAGWAVRTGFDAASPATPVAAEDGVLGLAPGDRLVPAPLARPLPAIAGVSASELLGDEAAPALEVPSDVVALDVVARAESLPFVGPTGLLLDLGTFVARYDPAAPLVTTTVLARADTPASVLEGLSEAGLTRAAGVAETRRTLDDSAYAQALRLYLVVAAALLLMALGGLLVSSAVQLPARRRDAASLRVVGVRRGTVLLASVWESVVVLGSAATAGLVAGGLALAVLLPSLRLGVVDEAVTPRVLPDPDVTRLAVFAVGVTLALMTVAVATSVAVVRRARAATLRETAR